MEFGVGFQSGMMEWIVEFRVEISDRKVKTSEIERECKMGKNVRNIRNVRKAESWNEKWASNLIITIGI